VASLPAKPLVQPQNIQLGKEDKLLIKIRKKEE
jgi:hypothetical protein